MPRRWSTTACVLKQLGYDSLWVWDHILLGVDPHFPIIESLTMLTAIAARTSKIKLGTGILVLPLRNPVALAKQLSSMDQFSGRPADHGHGVRLVQARVRRDGHAVREARQDHGREPRDPQPPLDRADGRGQVHGAQDFGGGDVSEAGAAAADADPDRRLCRQGAAARGDRRRRLADLFLLAGKLSRNRGPRSATSPRKAARIPTSCSTPRNCRS